jgi:hypothetical protein
MDKTVPSSFGLRIFTQRARFISNSVNVVQRWGTSEARTVVGVVIIEVFMARISALSGTICEVLGFMCRERILNWSGTVLRPSA